MHSDNLEDIGGSIRFDSSPVRLFYKGPPPDPLRPPETDAEPRTERVFAVVRIGVHPGWLVFVAALAGVLAFSAGLLAGRLLP